MKNPFFVLKNIKKDEIHRRLGIQQIEETLKPLSSHSKTKITELSKMDDSYHISFLDESKKDRMCVITMKSYTDSKEFPESTLLHCFWCRHSFSFRPIGCPLEYVPCRLTKMYRSEISKQENILYENMTNQQIKNFKMYYKPIPEGKENFLLEDRDYYLADGLFCSFNCCLSFILENKNNPLYYQSEHFLRKIYHDMYGKKTIPLVPAPSWRLLAAYGGHMTIEEFRLNFFKIEYQDIDSILIPFPKIKTVGFLFEKQVRI